MSVDETMADAASPAGTNSDADTDSDTETDGPEPHVEDELLVEEVSIDGMCGVY